MRERWIVAIGAGLGVVLLFYTLVWYPLQSNLSELRQSVAALRTDVAWMRQAAQDVKRLSAVAAQDGQTATAREESLLVLVDRTAKAAGLGSAVKRVEPQSNNQLQVRLEQVSFDQMIRWLGNLEQDYGVAIVNAVIDRQAQSGRVDARLVLQGSPS